MSDEVRIFGLTASAEQFCTWLTPLIRTWCQRTRLLDESAAGWIAEVLLAEAKAETQSLAMLRAAVRQHGRLITQAEKESRSIKGRLRFGTTFLDALTERGRSDPAYAVTVLIAEYSTMLSRELQRQLIMDSGMDARLMIRGGEKDCAAAARYARLTVAPAQLPRFPLPECDADHCRCSFMRAPMAAPAPVRQLATNESPARPGRYFADPPEAPPARRSDIFSVVERHWFLFMIAAAVLLWVLLRG
jgi:hypothetical protein